MKSIPSRAAAALALVVVVATGGVTLAEAQGAPPAGGPSTSTFDAGEQQQDAPDALSANCKKTYNSGAGITRFSWCFSNDGNVVKIEHSAGLEHVANGALTEGFCLSSNFAIRAESYGSYGNSGLNAPTYPSASKVAHTTSDGLWKIEQSFAQTTATKSITITMKLTNISGVLQEAVYLNRFVDADMSGTFENDFSSGLRSVEATSPGSARLELLPTSTNFYTYAMLYGNSLPTNNEYCYDSPSDANLSLTGIDGMMAVLYELGNVPAGASRTVKYVYQVSI